MKFNNICRPCVLTLHVLCLAFAPALHAQVNINFKDKTPELSAVEASVNQCAATQKKTDCLNALSHIRLTKTRWAQDEVSADSLMIDAVEILPLYMLSQLYARNSDLSKSCEYAAQADVLIRDIAARSARLMQSDPNAFKNVKRSMLGLDDIQAKFWKILEGC